MPNRPDNPRTYSAAGVDTAAAAALKDRVAALARGTVGSGVASEIGDFGGVFKPDPDADYYLVASTDSVGTKVKLAAATGRYDAAGHDIVNHCVNDILPAGATPLFFLDYIAAAKHSEELVLNTVRGVAEACKAVGCSLIGGETAAMPGVYSGGDYELAGFIVGKVAIADHLQPRRTVRPGDRLVALPSSGLHTNGFTLVRSVFNLDSDATALLQPLPGADTTLGEALTVPHRCYLQPLRPLLKRIKGMAHITGGGLRENVARILPDGLAAELDRASWEVPPLFRHIANSGRIADSEMFATFNMGVGMVVAVAPSELDGVLAALPRGWAIGQVAERAGGEPVRLTPPPSANAL